MGIRGQVLSTNLNGIRGQGQTLNLGFVYLNLNGIRGQANFFGPTLMEFVGKAISDQS